MFEKFFRAGTAWLFLFGGLFCYYLGFYEFNDVTLVKEITLRIGDVLVIGVILGYLTNISAYFGVSKADLEDIIYSRDFVKKRNDLHTIWENISRELFKSKFPHISRDLLNIIKTVYLPIDNISYYNDYNVSIDLSWVDQEKKLIMVKQKISFDLIAEDRCKIEFPLKSWINIEGLNKDEYHVKVLDYSVNNKDPKNVRVTQNVKNCIHEYCYMIDLEGELKYDISKKIEKQYSFHKDFDISFKAQFLINKLNVTFRHPKNIRANFINRGTIEDFKEINKTEDSLEMKYKSLIFPNQGYVIALQEINN